MASPRSVSVGSMAPSERRYRRSAFNGSKQLSAAQAPNRRILLLLALLALGLVAALLVIVGVHLQKEEDVSSFTPASATHQAIH